MNRMEIYSFDFFDDFYNLTWNVAVVNGSVSITKSGMISNKYSVLLNDTSSGGRTAIRTRNLLFRSCLRGYPPAFEVQTIGKTNLIGNHTFEQFLNYAGFNPNYSLSPPKRSNTWLHAKLKFFPNSVGGSGILFVRFFYLGYNNTLIYYDRVFTRGISEWYVNDYYTLSAFTYRAAVGYLQIDLIAYRQLHLTEEPQYRPSGKVYQHIRNGKGREVGVMSVGGVM